MKYMPSRVCRKSRWCGFSSEGTSLLELVIYIAVFSTLAAFLVEVFLIVTRSRTIVNARFEVNENMRFSMEKIQQSIFDSSLALTGGSCPLNTLELCIGPSPCTGSATTTFRVSGGILQVQEGSGNPFNDLTSSSTVIADSVDGSTCLFTKVFNYAPAKSTLQVKLKVSYNDQGKPELQHSDTAQVTMSLR